MTEIKDTLNYFEMERRKHSAPFLILYTQAIHALRKQLEQEENIPFSLNELSLMHDKWVWCAYINKKREGPGWCKVIHKQRFEHSVIENHYAGLLIKDYGITWLAYEYEIPLDKK